MTFRVRCDGWKNKKEVRGGKTFETDSWKMHGFVSQSDRTYFFYCDRTKFSGGLLKVVTGNELRVSRCSRVLIFVFVIKLGDKAVIRTTFISIRVFFNYASGIYRIFVINVC